MIDLYDFKFSFHTIHEKPSKTIYKGYLDVINQSIYYCSVCLALYSGPPKFVKPVKSENKKAFIELGI